MDDLAHLAAKSGYLLILDIPEGTDFGIDFMVFRCGPKFKGVKFIPPGVHIVYYTYGDVSVRSSFFLVLAPGEVEVRKWSHSTEQLIPIDADEAERYALGVRRFEFDSNLGVYPHDKFKKWGALSSHLTGEIIRLLEPVHRLIRSSIATTDGEQLLNREASVISDTASTLHFTPVPELSRSRTAVDSEGTAEQARQRAAEVSRLYLDRTWMLEKMATRYDGNVNAILGELQAAFICFLMGQDFNSLEHWKLLLDMLCRCESALHRWPAFISDLADIVRCQIREVPPDLFDDTSQDQNFVFTAMRNLIQLLLCSDDAVHHGKAQRIQKLAKKQFGWDIAEEDADDAPVIVDE